MNSYIVKEEYLGIGKGTIINPQNGKYFASVNGNTIEISKDNLDNSGYFEKQELFSIEEIEEENDVKKRYRVQIDINCTEERRKEIETFLRSNLNNILS